MKEKDIKLAPQSFFFFFFYLYEASLNLYSYKKKNDKKLLLMSTLQCLLTQPKEQ